MAGNGDIGIYGWYEEARPYHHADLMLISNPVADNARYFYSDLAEAAFPGYSRITASDLHDIYPDADVMPNELVRLTSRQLVYPNRGGIGVNVSGLALVVWTTISNPVVAIITPAPASIPIGGTIRGRHVITSTILDYQP